MMTNPTKTCVRKIYVHEKVFRRQNCGRKFIKILLPKKRKENM